MIAEKIKQEVIKQKGLPTFGCSLGPVSKYAYYNPAKKDKNGDIIIREAIPVIPFLKALSSIIILFGVIIKSSGGLAAFAGFISIIGFAVYYSFFYHRDKIIVNKIGITLEDRSYHWEDYSGAFLFFYRTKDTLLIEIVLLYEEGKYVFVDITKVGTVRSSRIATAIRDCQPENYKI